MTHPHRRQPNALKNSASESFFPALTTERVSRKIYRTRDEVRADLFDYIKRT